MKHGIFSLGLYREALKQTKTTAIVSFVMVGLITVFTAISYWISAMEELIYIQGHQGMVFVKPVLSGLEMCGTLICIGLFTAPLLVYQLHGFQNKRSTSDFYHALPHTRLCLFLSLQAAALTHLIGLIVASCLLSCLLGLLMSSLVTFVAAPLLLYALCTLSVGILLSSVVALAMSLTGTPFSNFILGGLILFLPRMLLFLISNSVSSLIYNLVPEHFMPFASPNLNMATGLLFSFLGLLFGGGFTDQVTYLPAILYTTLLGLCYTALSAFFFHRRRSEAAGLSAPSPRLQTVYRITVGTTVSILGSFFFYNELIGGSGAPFFTCLIFWILGIVAYYLYELLTTKRWRNLIRATPALSLVLAVNLLLIGVTHVAFVTERDYAPEANQIKSISISATAKLNDHRIPFAEYAAYRAGRIAITDREIITKLAQAMQQNVADAKSMSERQFFDKYENRDYKVNDSGDIMADPIFFSSQSFCIRTALGEKHRVIYFPTELLSDISAALEQNPDYRKTWTTVPPMIRDTGYLISDWLWSVRDLTVTEEQITSLHAMLTEEIRSCEFASWYSLLTSGANAPFSLVYNTMDGVTAHHIVLPIFPEIAPQTTRMMLSYFEDDTAALELSIKRIRDQLSQNDAYSCDISGNVALRTANHGFESYAIEIKDIYDSKLDLILSHALPADRVTNETAYVSLSIGTYNDDSDELWKQTYSESYGLIPLDMTREEILTQIVGMKEEEVDGDKYPVETSRPDSNPLPR